MFLKIKINAKKFMEKESIKILNRERIQPVTQDGWGGVGVLCGFVSCELNPRFPELVVSLLIPSLFL